MAVLSARSRARVVPTKTRSPHARSCAAAGPASFRAANPTKEADQHDVAPRLTPAATYRERHARGRLILSDIADAAPPPPTRSPRQPRRDAAETSNAPRPPLPASSSASATGAQPTAEKAERNGTTASSKPLDPHLNQSGGASRPRRSKERTSRKRPQPGGRVAGRRRWRRRRRRRSRPTPSAFLLITYDSRGYKQQKSTSIAAQAARKVRAPVHAMPFTRRRREAVAIFYSRTQNGGASDVRAAQHAPATMANAHRNAPGPRRASKHKTEYTNKEVPRERHETRAAGAREGAARRSHHRARAGRCVDSADAAVVATPRHTRARVTARLRAFGRDTIVAPAPRPATG